jgi:hypothetical protein
MEKTIKAGIKSILQSITAVKEVYMYPATPTKYPAVVCMSDNMDNTFETTSENFKVYRFKIWIEVAISGTTEANVFESVLPNVSDAVIAKFDNSWNGGVISGHRVWQVISGGREGYVVNEKSKSAFKELTLTVKLATTN